VSCGCAVQRAAAYKLYNRHVMLMAHAVPYSTQRCADRSPLTVADEL
jgi:hypothetical protein